MTLPPSNAQPSGSLPRRPLILPPAHSISAAPSIPQYTPPVSSTYRPSTPPAVEASDKIGHEHVLDIATHSWDLATGGLKTLTAKREVLPLAGHRVTELLPDTQGTSRSYTYFLTILACVVLMLIGGGVVLFVMLQP